MESLQQRAIGERIRTLRELKRMNQKGLAAMAGISQSKLSKLEHGLQSVTIQTITRIAGALGCSVQDILTADSWLVSFTPLASAKPA